MSSETDKTGDLKLLSDREVSKPVRGGTKLPEQILQILLRLERMTRLLRLLGLLSSICTGANLLLAFITLLGPRFYGSSTKLITTAMLEITAIALILVTLHEYSRKSGDTLFEEISDDLQKNSRSSDLNLRRSKVPSRKKGVPTSAKYALRTFAKATDLPLIPGRFGPAIYAGINLALLFLHYFITSSQLRD